ncbi:MAG TPA: DUF2345 domain-containing protein, partial [Noviherbaspirillum sp.]|nr:DUF2345 domain-containing protein [Noviherbaspirillum sp.]
GMFISTAQRTGARSTQFDAQEAQEKLNFAAELAGALSEAVAQHQAMPISKLDNMRHLAKTIVVTASADGRQAPAFEHPMALLDGQAGIMAATPASSVVFAGQNISLTAASALRMSAGQAASISVAKTASLFTHAGGAKVVAAKEAVSVRAHTGPMDALADQALSVTSSNGGIRVQAKQEILLASGGGYIRLSGSNIETHCPSSVSIKGSAHDFLGAGKISAVLPALPDTRIKLFDEIFELKDEESGEPLVYQTYRIKRADDSYEYGQTDEMGRTHAVMTHTSEPISIEML